MPNFVETLEISGACKEESSDESTIISSQTSTLTRNQDHHTNMKDHQIAEELKEHLKLNEEEPEEEEKEEEEEGSGEKQEDCEDGDDVDDDDDDTNSEINVDLTKKC